MNIILKNTKKIFTSTTSNSGGGGITSVVGGTNITIDNTDPSNPIINGVAASSIIVVANYSALPAANTASGQFYWCSASQGISWLSGSWGGTYYNSGLYYSNGITWEFLNVPYNATQSEVNTGTNADKFVTPFTLAGWLISVIAPVYQTIITYTNWGTFLHAATNKTTPVSADEVGVWNSATGDLNRVSITNLRTAFYQNITITSSATPTIDVGNYRDTFVSITALATAITSFVITGTPVDGNKLWIRYKDNGTARAISHSASGGGMSIVARGGILLTTTVTSKVSNEGFSWNAATSTWDCVASNTEI